MQPVEWVLVVYYGPEAHRATYGRKVRSNRYTKDYIQLSRRPEFLEVARRVFRLGEGETGQVQLVFEWPAGTAPGSFVLRSGDRPHLKWETHLGAPAVWKMSLAAGEAGPETIPGDPSHVDFDSAENERVLLSERGAGQPYLVAVKLLHEPATLHLRVYLEGPEAEYSWADIRQTPEEIQRLAARTSQTSALASEAFQSSGLAIREFSPAAIRRLLEPEAPEIAALSSEQARNLIRYLRDPGYGLFFDPRRNHDCWMVPPDLAEVSTETISRLARALEERIVPPLGDALAETFDSSPDELEAFRTQIEEQNFTVLDARVTAKTRGSAQRVFSEAVKRNYGYRCAITGIESREFLVAAHIVPWSADETIRLDPSNGICLSLLMDRAFESGHLQLEDDLTMRIDWDRVGDDTALRSTLEQFDGQKLAAPVAGFPNPIYLARRRLLVGS